MPSPIAGCWWSLVGILRTICGLARSRALKTSGAQGSRRCAAAHSKPWRNHDQHDADTRYQCRLPRPSYNACTFDGRDRPHAARGCRGHRYGPRKTPAHTPARADLAPFSNCVVPHLPSAGSRPERSPTCKRSLNGTGSTRRRETMRTERSREHARSCFPPRAQHVA